MPILEKFTKQPADVQDIDINFVDWLAALNDTPLSVSVPAVTGITQPIAAAITAGIVKVWVSGGTTGQSYKMTINLTTAGGRTKQVEILIKVKET